MTEILIRAARRADVPAIVALLADDPLGRERERNTDPLPAAYWQAFDDLAVYPGNFLFVAEAGGSVIGCLQLTVMPGLSHCGTRRGQIEAVRVAAASRSSGVGEHLVRHAIDMARSEGCGLVQLTSDRSRTAAHRFYERLGFTGSHLGMKLALR
jgi:ribosomal protein S18 acetylase RimI-like enzyme